MKYSRQLFGYILKSAGLFVLLSLFWLLPIALGHGSAAISTVADRGLFGNDLFNLTHALTVADSPWTGGAPDENFVLQNIKIYLWIIPFIAFMPLLRIRNLSCSHQKNVIFFLALSLLGIILSKQSTDPIAGLYSFLYSHFPGFKLYREASKFFLITCIGYLGLLSYAIKLYGSNQFAKVALITAVAMVSVINLSPLASGSIKTLFVSRQMPSDYHILEAKLSHDNNFYRTVWLPTSSRWGFFDNTHPKN